ncbi:HFL021Cp [Eremothecium sinecaudum]|uniref:HFL021Cp n=1 Tax=Eremothecium sinecaudum TaxID=45286 RepID=A0A0X8HUQ6_9SACH|nr:HFL021Cp [Eremothecium sinecaudum]AMD21835.1 HFL021Cp [Eremothecium sinecaudum]
MLAEASPTVEEEDSTQTDTCYTSTSSGASLTAGRSGSSTGGAGNYQARTRKRWSGAKNNLSSRLNSPAAIDGVHGSVEADYISPGQLYSTESGRMFHAGQILIVLVGLPATSKTLLSVAITRYTRWLGVRTSSFHVSEYRRDKTANDVGPLPEDYFLAKPMTQAGSKFRQEILDEVLEDIHRFFRQDKGQLAIYDCLNIIRSDRERLAREFAEFNIKVLLIESIVTNEELLSHNIEMAATSADYHGWNKQDAMKHYLQRVKLNKPFYEQMTPSEGLSYLQYFNFGEKIVLNDNDHGFLVNKIVFFLMNLRHKRGCIYFARCGTSDNDRYVHDEVLNEEGIRYSKALTDLVLKQVSKRRAERNESLACQIPTSPLSFPSANSADDSPVLSANASQKSTDSISKLYLRQRTSGEENSENSFTVWTAPRKRTYDTAMFFLEKGVTVRQRSQLQQLHPGCVADLSEGEIKEKFPTEYKEYLKAPYHYRFPRAESYHDLAVRIEPLLLEMERMCGDLLIIGHETALRVLYGYFAACSSQEIPSLSFTRDDLIEISLRPFENIITKIPIVVNK